MRTLPLIAISACLAIGVSGCGEKSEPEPAAPPVDTTTTQRDRGQGGSGQDNHSGGGQKLSPEERIEANVITVVGGGDPAATCGELTTPGYVKRAYGDEQGCRAAVSKQRAVEVKVSAIQIAGAKATATAMPAGGPNKGERIRVELVADGAAWKVDSAVSNAPAGP